jgi:putative transposase
LAAVCPQVVIFRSVADEQARAELRGDLDELAREGARRMLAAALEAEVDDYLVVHAAERDERGRRLVVRNGHARQREVLTAAGAVRVQAGGRPPHRPGDG